MIDIIRHYAIDFQELNSGSSSAETARQVEDMRHRHEHDAIQANSTNDPSRDEWRRMKSVADGVAAVHENYLSHLEAGKDSVPLQQDTHNMHDKVLVPSGLRDRHAIPPCIAARNALMSTTSQTPCLQARPGLEHIEVVTPVATHVECIRELDDADSIADGAVDVKPEPSTWATRASAFISRKKSTCQTSGVIVAEDRQAPTGFRKRSLFSQYVFGEKIVQPVKDTTHSTRSGKRKASRALSDIITESAQFIAERIRRRDSGFATKSPHGRRSHSADRTEKSRVKNWPYQRPYPSREDEFGNGSSSSLGSPHYSIVAAGDIPDMHEPFSRDRAAAVEELQPLIADRSSMEGSSTMRRRKGRAMPSIQLAHTAATPEMTMAQTEAEMARVILALAIRVHIQAKEGRCASWRVEQRFESIHRDTRSDVGYQESVGREYLAEVAAEKREMAQDHKTAMEEWNRKGRPVVESWRS